MCIFPLIIKKGLTAYIIKLSVIYKMYTGKAKTHHLAETHLKTKYKSNYLMAFINDTKKSYSLNKNRHRG